MNQAVTQERHSDAYAQPQPRGTSACAQALLERGLETPLVENGLRSRTEI
jgi:hypothetical protein